MNVKLASRRAYRNNWQDRSQPRGSNLKARVPQRTRPPSESETKGCADARRTARVARHNGARPEKSVRVTAMSSKPWPPFTVSPAACRCTRARGGGTPVTSLNIICSRVHAGSVAVPRRIAGPRCLWENSARGSRGTASRRRAVPAGPLGGFKDILCRVQASRVNYLRPRDRARCPGRERIAKDYR